MSNFNMGAPGFDGKPLPGEPFELYYMRPIEDFALQESFTRVAVPALRKKIEADKLLFAPESLKIRFLQHPKFGPVWRATIEVRERT